MKQGGYKRNVHYDIMYIIVFHYFLNSSNTGKLIIGKLSDPINLSGGCFHTDNEVPLNPGKE
jgi:hypothetical protein